MRLKPGRPDLDRYRRLFAVPAASAAAPLTTTWLGVATLLIDDGTSALMTDGFFSRPALPAVALRRIAPNPARVDGCLARARVQRLAAVLPVHTHYDHALDSALVAHRTEALLVGGASAGNIARGHGLPEQRIRIARSGEPLRLGAYEVTLIESHHCPPDRYPGVITSPVPRRARTSAYRCGEAWSTMVHHLPSDRRLLIQGSAGYVAGALDGHRAEVACLGIGQLGVQSQSYLTEYWAQTVRAVGARTVIAIHWDDFFRPLSKPLRALPYAADDLDVTLDVLGSLAAADGVSLHLPTVWQRQDPWAAWA